MGHSPAQCQVVVLHTLATPDQVPWRLLPAALVSAGFHVCFFGLLFLLSNPLQAEGPPTEPGTNLYQIDTDALEDPLAREPFLADEENPFSSEKDQNLNNDSPRKDRITIFGETDPLREVGAWGEEKGPPVTLPPPPGFQIPGSGGGEYNSVFPGPPMIHDGKGGLYRGAWRPGTLDARGSAATREFQVRVGGGSPASEAAVARALIWLARHQSADGKWMMDGNFKDQGTANDIAGTALGLLPFLAAGLTHKFAKDNPYDKPIEKGLLFLLRRQDKSTGRFPGDLYSHGLATIALCEAFGLSQDFSLRNPAQKAINALVRAQHDGGGWRYVPGQAGDLSVTGWQIMALKSGQMAGLDVPALTFRKAERFLDSVCDPKNEGYGYTGPGAGEAMSAVGFLCRQYLQGWGAKNPRLHKGVEANLLTVPPGARKNIYYYYYATQVMHHFGGEAWTRWNEKMREQLIQSQDQSEGPNRGSWSSEGDAYSSAGGRLMMTSLSVLTLQVYYRYLPLYQRTASQ